MNQAQPVAGVKNSELKPLITSSFERVAKVAKRECVGIAKAQIAAIALTGTMPSKEKNIVSAIPKMVV